MARYNDRQRKALEKLMREDVHKEATQILETEGLGGLTLERIAKAVGVSRATLYNYFKDRDALLVCVEERIVSPIEKACSEVAARHELPVTERLDAIVGITIGAMIEKRALLVALFTREHTEGPLWESKASRRRRILELFSGLIREGIEQGRFRRVNADLAAELYIGAMLSYLDSMVYEPASSRSADEVVPLIASMLRRGLERSPGDDSD